MWFQRLVEIDDDSEPEPVAMPTERLTTVQIGRTKKPKVAVSTPADFQRVRLMSIVRPGKQKAKGESETAYATDQSKTDTILNGEVDDIPPGARWTKISRKLVNPAALEAGKERFEEREDFLIVQRVLSKDEVQAYAEATDRIRGEDS